MMNAIGVRAIRDRGAQAERDRAPDDPRAMRASTHRSSGDLYTPKASARDEPAERETARAR